VKGGGSWFLVPGSWLWRAALNKDLEGIFGSAHVSTSDKPEIIAEKIANFLSPVLVENNLREITKKNHDLVFLGNRIAEEIQ
jgi:hypothetical protein